MDKKRIALCFKFSGLPHVNISANNIYVILIIAKQIVVAIHISRLLIILHNNQNAICYAKIIGIFQKRTY